LPHARHEERIVAAAMNRTHLVQLGGLEPPTSWSTVSLSRSYGSFWRFPFFPKTSRFQAFTMFLLFR
jgi:hypothetical protein